MAKRTKTTVKLQLTVTLPENVTVSQLCQFIREAIADQKAHEWYVDMTTVKIGLLSREVKYG